MVFGESGSGKTSVLAKAASLTRAWLPEDRRVSSLVIVRFLGTTPATSSISQTMRMLCRQLAFFGNEADRELCRTTEDLKGLSDLFYELLARLGAFRRVVLFIDSVDQLDSSSGAYHLTWLRTALPERVKLVLSTLPRHFGILKTLRQMLPDPSDYLEVTPLEQGLCHTILRALLHERGRDLSEPQWAVVRAAFEQCSLPIFIYLIFHKVLAWRSFEPESHLHTASSVREAIAQLFADLEAKHGKIFVSGVLGGVVDLCRCVTLPSPLQTSHALGYITASRNGLSEGELEDVLSLDDEVLRDVFQFHLPPLTRIPPLCWTRLRQDIGSYLVEREADNTRVVYWLVEEEVEKLWIGKVFGKV